MHQNLIVETSHACVGHIIGLLNLILYKLLEIADAEKLGKKLKPDSQKGVT